MNDVAKWLAAIGLGEYEKVFRDNDLDLDLIPDLTPGELRGLGLTLGHRKKLQHAVEALRADRFPVARASASEPVGAATNHGQRFERRQVTVLFCDVVDSVVLATTLDPEVLSDVLRAYQEVCRAAVEGYDGYIAQFRGDGILAYFGYPRAHEHDPERAVRAGLAIIADLPALNDRLRNIIGRNLQIRLAAATGIVVAGDVTGEEAEAQRLAVGETPNLAARLQGVAAPNTLVVAPSTRRLLGGMFTLRDFGLHELKGIAAPTRAWHVVAEISAASRFEATHSARLTRMVGREEEMKSLVHYWQCACESRGRMVLLRGEPGIGKSRVVESVYETLREEDHLRLRFQCSPYYQNSDLYPVITCLELGSGIQPSDSPDTRLDKLRSWLCSQVEQPHERLALFSRLLSIPARNDQPPGRMTPAQIKEHTLVALGQYVADLSRVHPVLCVVEDAHWIDPTTFDLVERLREQSMNQRVLAVLTYREDLTIPLSGAVGTSSIILTRLSDEQGARMVRDIAGPRAVSREIVSEIVVKADGIPLFIEELTASVLESLTQTVSTDREHGAASRRQAPEIPTTLHDSLMARLDRLEYGEEVAQLGALIGRSFSYRLLRSISVLEESKLRAGVQSLVDAELLQLRGDVPDAVFKFKHALIQEVAYGMMLNRERRKLHRRLAEVLESDSSETSEARPEIVGHHYSAAGLPEQAIARWTEAGMLATKRSANIEAEAHLRAALREFDAHADSTWARREEQELAVCLALGPPLIANLGWAADEVERNYLRAQRLCRGDGGENLFQVLRGLVNVYLLRGDLRAAEPLGHELVEMAERAEDDALFLEAYRVLGICNFLAGRFDTAASLMDRVLAIYDSERHQDHAYMYGVNPAVVAACWRAWTHWFLGDVSRSLETVDATVALAREIDHPFSLGYALSFSATIAQSRDDAGAAYEQAVATIELATAHGHRYWRAWGTIIKGWAQARLEGQGAGVALLKDGLAQYRQTGASMIKTYGLTLLAQAYRDCGRLDDGLHAIEEALVVQDESGLRFFAPESCRVHGEIIALTQGSGNAARASYNRAISLAREQGAMLPEFRATLALLRAMSKVERRAHGERMQRLDQLCTTLGGTASDIERELARSLLDDS